MQGFEVVAVAGFMLQPLQAEASGFQRCEAPIGFSVGWVSEVAREPKHEQGVSLSHHRL